MFLKVVSAIQVVSCCVVLVTSQGWVVDDDGCRTPDRGVGICMPIRDCGMMVTFLQNVPKPLSSSNRKKLREYICGYEGNNVKVCCPGKAIPLAVSEKKIPDEAARGDDVRNHRNLKLLPRECGYMGIPDKISNGQNANLGAYPWMALLSYQTSNGLQFKCGGTVINDRYILTAAHCITQLKEQLIGVRVGEYDLSTRVDCEDQPDGTTKCIDAPVQDLVIEKIIPHPNFTKEFSGIDGFNDIGLLRIERIQPAVNVQPICLPTEDSNNAKLNHVTITGWGITGSDQKVSNVLQEVSLPVITHSKCQNLYKRIKISTKQLCADGKEKDSCKGDSGGPLQTAKYVNDDTRMVQYGIISFGGAYCGSGDFPGLYTRVDSYLKWILDNIEP